MRREVKRVRGAEVRRKDPINVASYDRLPTHRSPSSGKRKAKWTRKRRKGWQSRGILVRLFVDEIVYMCTVGAFNVTPVAVSVWNLT